MNILSSLTGFFSQRKGFIYAAIAAITFGMNPLFAKPLYGLGFNADSVLLMRYLPAAVFVFFLLKIEKVSLKLTRLEFFHSLICGMLFSMCSLFLFISYEMMDAGIASTLFFVYPVVTTLIMTLCFHEKLSKLIICCILLSLAGIALLCRTADGGFLTQKGIFFILASAQFYGIYIVAVNKLSAAQQMHSNKLTFYVLCFGIITYLIRLKFGLEFKGTFNVLALINIVGIVIFSTILSLEFTTLAVRHVGATPTAIIGALEPASGIFWGIVVFHEVLTPRMILGIVMILQSVILITWKKGKANAAENNNCIPAAEQENQPS